MRCGWRSRSLALVVWRATNASTCGLQRASLSPCSNFKGIAVCLSQCTFRMGCSRNPSANACWPGTMCSVKELIAPIAFECAADREMAELRDWPLVWRCSAHVCSLGLKWGIRRFVVADLLDSVHVSISGLLRSSSGLLGEVRHFLVGCVVSDRPAPSNQSDVELCWTFLMWTLHTWSSLSV